MYFKTEGILLHGLKYGDNGRIVTVYTEAFGRCSFLLQGIHGKKSANKANLLQPLFLLGMEIDHRQGRELQRAREIRMNHSYQTVPYDVVKSSQALFLSEFLHKVLKEEEARPELFHFLNHSFQILDLLEEGAANFHLVFLAQLTRYMGFAPTSNHSPDRPIFDLASGAFTATPPPHPYFLDEAESRILVEIISISYEEIGTLVLSSSLRNKMLIKMINYFSLHLGVQLNIKSLDILHEMFS